MTETRSYRGYITLGTYGEGEDILYLTEVRGKRDGYDEEPLAEDIQEDLERLGRYISVRYWTRDKPLPDEEMKTEFIVSQLGGEGYARFRQRYSEVTGYLWTDEDLKVGGHDLLAELTSQQGEYCLLEIDYSREPLK